MPPVEDGAFRVWPRRPPLFDASALYLAATAGLVVATALARGCARLFPSVASSVFSYLWTALYQGGVLLFPVFSYARKRPGAFAAMRFTPPAAPGVVLAVLSAMVGVFLCDNLGALWLLLIEGLGGRVGQSGLALAEGAAGRAAQLLLVALVPAVCEETAFRGMLLSAWERRGTRRAVVVTALLFAILHGNIEGLPVQFVVGLALGYVVVETGSVYTGMIYHAVHNGMLLGTAMLGASGTAALGGSLYESLGGAAGVGLIALNTLLLGAVYAVLLIAFRFVKPGGAAPIRPAPPEDEPQPDAGMLTVLACGVATALIMLALDLLGVMGVVG